MVARLVRARGLAAAVDRVTPAVVRRIVSGGTGAGLVLGTLVASLPVPDLTRPPDASTVAASPRPAPAHPGAETATMARVSQATATMTRTTPGCRRRRGDDDPPRGPDHRLRLGGSGRNDDPPRRRMHRPSPSRPTPVAVAPAAAPALPPAPALPAVDAATWLVEAGDSLWSIAEDVVRTARPEAADRIVTRYWRALTDANRAHLVDPDNPDLLVPGQPLTLPTFTD